MGQTRDIEMALRHILYLLKRRSFLKFCIPATVMPIVTTVCVVFLVLTLRNKGPALFVSLIATIISIVCTIIWTLSACFLHREYVIWSKTSFPKVNSLEPFSISSDLEVKESTVMGNVHSIRETRNSRISDARSLQSED